MEKLNTGSGPLSDEHLALNAELTSVLSGLDRELIGKSAYLGIIAPADIPTENHAANLTIPFTIVADSSSPDFKDVQFAVNNTRAVRLGSLTYFPLVCDIDMLTLTNDHIPDLISYPSDLALLCRISHGTHTAMLARTIKQLLVIVPHDKQDPLKRALVKEIVAQERRELAHLSGSLGPPPDEATRTQFWSERIDRSYFHDK